MNKYELLEDMKDNMLALVGMSEIPIDVRKGLENCCNKLKEIVSQYNSNPENIFEYIDMNYGYVENMLQNVNNEKTNSMASELMHKCRRMEQKLRENEEENPEKNRAEFREIIGGKNIKVTNRIVATVCDYIRDVSNRAANILEYRGYSDYTIDEQGNEINQLISSVESMKSQENIFQKLEEHDKDLLDKVMSQYEIYQQNLEREDKNEQDNNSSRKEQEKSFRESLRNGAPDLEEQKNNSIEFLKEQEERISQSTNKNIMALDEDVII